MGIGARKVVIDLHASAMALEPNGEIDQGIECRRGIDVDAVVFIGTKI